MLKEKKCLLIAKVRLEMEVYANAMQVDSMFNSLGQSHVESTFECELCVSRHMLSSVREPCE